MWTTIIVIFVVIAILGLSIGVFVRSMSKTHWLKQHGTHIIARVSDSIFSAGSGTTKVIIAEWTDPRTTTTYQFRTYVPQSAHVKLGRIGRCADRPNPSRTLHGHLG